MSDSNESSKIKPKTVTLHCTDTPDEQEFTAANIDAWHKQKGWKKIGYHYVIRKDGTIEKGRDDFEPGAHVKDHNTGNLGVVWVGRYHVTEAQRFAILYLYHYIRIKHGIHSDQWFGHYEWDTGHAQGKTCPNLEMKDVRQYLKESIELIPKF